MSQTVLVVVAKNIAVGCLFLPELICMRRPDFNGPFALVIEWIGINYEAELSFGRKIRLVDVSLSSSPKMP